MWFFQQKELDKDGSLFIKIIAVSVAFHIAVILAVVIGDFFASTQTLMLGKKGGAPVRMAGPRAQAKHTPVPVAALAATPVDTTPVTTTAAPAEQVQQSRQVCAKSQPQGKKQEVFQKQKDEGKAQPKSDMPLFSKLQKKYTTLKKKPGAKAEKKDIPVQVKEPAMPKQEDVTKQEPINKNVQPILPANQIQGARGQDEPLAERLEFVSDESGQADNGIVQEIQRHYRRPPGFDDHESFVITFEIIQGKATAISPKGSEPLAIYSAIKDALLKGTFPVTKFAIKKELIVSAGG